MKTIGIVIDNYKQQKFEKELTSGGFADYKITPFTTKTSVIKVTTEENKITKLQKLCEKLQRSFSPLNN